MTVDDPAMNELLAIVLIVLLCCAMFFAWLFALATCPDRMVNLISGSKPRSLCSSSPNSRASEDLVGGCAEETDCAVRTSMLPLPEKRSSPSSQRDLRPLIGRSRSIPANRSNGFIVALSQEKRSNSKKLSVVPEADEQLTVTSISQCLRSPSSPKTLMGAIGAQDSALVVKTVLLTRHHSDLGPKGSLETKVEEEEEEEREDEYTQEQLRNRALSTDLYNDGPTSAFSSECGDENANNDGALVGAASRRSAPPSIHIV